MPPPLEDEIDDLDLVPIWAQVAHPKPEPGVNGQGNPGMERNGLVSGDRINEEEDELAMDDVVLDNAAALGANSKPATPDDPDSEGAGRPGTSHSIVKLPTLGTEPSGPGYAEGANGNGMGASHAMGSQRLLTPSTSNNQSSSPSPEPPVVGLPVTEAADADTTKTEQEIPAEIPAEVKFEIDLCQSTLINPRSLFTGFKDCDLNESPKPAPGPVCVDEKEAVRMLSWHARAAKGSEEPKNEFEFELDQFCAYIDPPKGNTYPNELRSLQQLSTRRGRAVMYFDGVLSFAGHQYYVKKRPFDELPIGNYGSDFDTVGDQVWIRSKLNSNKEIYYRLKGPSLEYVQYYSLFLWVADLAKHFVDFAKHNLEQGSPTTIHDFQDRFSSWLFRTHAGSATLQKWYDQHGRADFRSAVASNLEFIYKETHGVLGSNGRRLTIFSEALRLDRYKEQSGPFALPPRPNSDGETDELLMDEAMDPEDAADDEESSQRGSKKEIPMTIVTPYINDCFSHMQVGVLLQPVQSDFNQDTVANFGAAARKDFSFTQHTRQPEAKLSERILDIQPGDVISTQPDDPSCSKWRPEVSMGFDGAIRWYAVVRKVNVQKRSRQFDVTWLYRPVDTPCGQMKYPWPNELFLSDHCTCEEGRDSKIDAQDVLGVHSVEWMGEPDTEAEFFIRQVYLSGDRRWVTLEEKYLHCHHDEDYDEPQYHPGDTVLARVSKEELEPFEILEIEPGKVKLRRFLRRAKVDSHARNAPPNELIYTDSRVSCTPGVIVSRCVIRAFKPTDKIPTPYDRNGTGNIFYVTLRKMVTDGGVKFVPLVVDHSVTFRQGFDPAKAGFKKLRGMDLFAGCGNFGRGLEDGGAVNMLWAADIWDNAVHTYMANAKHPRSTHPFLGSVDDLLHHALLGNFGPSVPKPDKVDFISGGSPCPGFSLLTVDKTTLKQVKNRSLVASFASYIDFYRPKYGVLENVTTMVQKGASRSAEDIFSQLVCALVGLGYQTEIMLGNAWSYGAPQSRSRVFLYFAAPGLSLPKAPIPSHSSPARFRLNSLGKMANDENFVDPAIGPTAFEFVSAGAACADLPPIDNAKADICISVPSHRLASPITRLGRWQINSIPLYPYGMSFAKAWLNGKGTMTKTERECFPEKGSRVEPISKGWTRVNPTELFSTVTTTCKFTDARTGKWVHWKEQRPISIEEARRAQGMPPEEVLLGSPLHQWKLVGNAVARQPALALGLAFREGWVGSLYADGKRNEFGRPRQSNGQSDLEDEESQVSQVDDEDVDTEDRVTDGTDITMPDATPTSEHDGTRASSQAATSATTAADTSTAVMVTALNRSTATTMTTVSETVVQTSVTRQGGKKRSWTTMTQLHTEVVSSIATPASQDNQEPSVPGSRPRRARKSEPIYNLKKLSGTNIHRKRRSNGDSISERHMRRPLSSPPRPTEVDEPSSKRRRIDEAHDQDELSMVEMPVQGVDAPAEMVQKQGDERVIPDFQSQASL